MECKCQWCGLSLKAEPFFLCPYCWGLSRRWNWELSFFKVAILPLMAFALTLWFDNYQKNQERLQILQQKYIQLNDAIGDFRKAGMEIELSCIGVDSSICYQKLYAGIADLDTAFNKIANSISPLAAFARSKGQKKLANDIELTWLRCFQIPYHGNNMGFPVEERYWIKFRRVLEKECENGMCNRIAGKKAERLVFEIFSGRCYENIPEKSRNLMWFSDQAYKIINNDFPISYPGERPCVQ